MASEMMTSPETMPNQQPATPAAQAAAPSRAPSVEPSVLEAAMSPTHYGEFKMPEGMNIDSGTLDQAHALFSEARLPQEQAQKFIDLAVARERSFAERGVKAFVDMQNKWVSEIKADPDIGGARMNASLASAARAIDRLAVPGLKEALSFTGAGNHPAVVKAFVRLGQMISEDRFAPGHAAAPTASRSAAETIYDGNPKQ